MSLISKAVEEEWEDSRFIEEIKKIKEPIVLLEEMVHSESLFVAEGYEDIRDAFLRQAQEIIIKVNKELSCRKFDPENEDCLKCRKSVWCGKVSRGCFAMKRQSINEDEELDLSYLEG